MTKIKLLSRILTQACFAFSALSAYAVPTDDPLIKQEPEAAYEFALPIPQNFVPHIIKQEPLEEEEYVPKNKESLIQKKTKKSKTPTADLLDADDKTFLQPFIEKFAAVEQTLARADTPDKKSLQALREEQLEIFTVVYEHLNQKYKTSSHTDIAEVLQTNEKKTWSLYRSLNRKKVLNTKTIKLGSLEIIKPKQSQPESQLQTYTVTSLFSGIGGLDLGFCGGFDYLEENFPDNGFHIITANDIDQTCCTAYADNLKHPIYWGDLDSLLSQNLPHTDVLLGGFPCQDFSSLGARKGLQGESGSTFKALCETIKNVHPIIFFLENVKSLTQTDFKDDFETIISELEKIGYHVTHKVLNAKDFGIPQTRNRLIIAGILNGLPFFDFATVQSYSKNKVVTFQNALEDLADAKEGYFVNHKWGKHKVNLNYNGASKKLGEANYASISPTIIGERSGMPRHYKHERPISVREAMRLQSFPDTFVLDTSTTNAYKLVGNAVPPVLAWYLGKSAQKFLNDNKEIIAELKNQRENLMMPNGTLPSLEPTEHTPINTTRYERNPRLVHAADSAYLLYHAPYKTLYISNDNQPLIIDEKLINQVEYYERTGIIFDTVASGLRDGILRIASPAMSFIAA